MTPDERFTEIEKDISDLRAEHEREVKGIDELVATLARISENQRLLAECVRLIFFSVEQSVRDKNHALSFSANFNQLKLPPPPKSDNSSGQ